MAETSMNKNSVRHSSPQSILLPACIISSDTITGKIFIVGVARVEANVNCKSGGHGFYRVLFSLVVIIESVSRDNQASYYLPDDELVNKQRDASAEADQFPDEGKMSRNRFSSPGGRCLTKDRNNPLIREAAYSFELKGGGGTGNTLSVIHMPIKHWFPPERNASHAHMNSVLLQFFLLNYEQITSW